MVYINTFPAPRTEGKFLQASGDQMQAGLAGRDLQTLGETPTSWAALPPVGPSRSGSEAPTTSLRQIGSYAL